MAFGLTAFTDTPQGQTALKIVFANRDALIAATDRGEAPIRVIAAQMSDILGDRATNGFVGRLISNLLQPMFRRRGRKKWPRENGTESGTTFARR